MDTDRKSMFCPLMKEQCVSGWTKSMGQDEKTGERTSCRFWTRLAGKDPQSQQVVDHFDCAIAWLPVVGIENSQMTRQVAAQVSQVTNAFVSALPKGIRGRVVDPEIPVIPENLNGSS